MRRIVLVLASLLALFTLAACGNDDTDGADDELKMLEVEFEVPETLDVGETLKLEAVVTYGDESVKDADEVVFEVWERGDQDNGEMIDAKNNDDGTYTAETSFDHDGIYEMYAHTTARTMHTMPKREVIVGEGGEYDDVDEEGDFHNKLFDMHFMAPENVKAGEDTELIVHLFMLEEEFEDAEVRYEIWTDDNPDEPDWIDAKESDAGEYKATHAFEEANTYNIQIHVEDDNDLHEHEEHQVEVTN